MANIQDAEISEPSESVRELIGAYKGLSWDDRTGLNGGASYLFMKLSHDASVTPPTTLPSIAHADSIYFVIPQKTDLKGHWAVAAFPFLLRDPACEGVAFIPPKKSDLTRHATPDSAAIVEAIDAHRIAVLTVEKTRQAKASLEQARGASAGLYASAAPIHKTTPMLVEGLLRERGVSVVYGSPDDFKTTAIADMVAHIAAGTPWQGLQVSARPVIWYALEGKDAMLVRLAALGARLKTKDTEWGNDWLPITVRDRIPGNYFAKNSGEWRAEIAEISRRWDGVYSDRYTLRELPEAQDYIRYPEPLDTLPLVVLDTFSIALGGEDEKGPRAPGLINACLNLLKDIPELGAAKDDADIDLRSAVASHVIIIHHQTKTSVDIAGHRAIVGDTQALFRVHRPGKMAGAARPYSGWITPIRTKDMALPSPIRFEVEVVQIEGTQQTAAILKDKTAEVPKELKAVIEALRKLDDCEEISAKDLNDCLDVEAAKDGRDGSAMRMERKRMREKLDALGIVEAVTDDNDKIAFYRFHDPGAV
jgi:hypothetical protein